MYDTLCNEYPMNFYSIFIRNNKGKQTNAENPYSMKTLLTITHTSVSNTISPRRRDEKGI